MTSNLNSSIKHKSQFVDPSDVSFSLQLKILGQEMEVSVLFGDNRHSLIDRLCLMHNIPDEFKDVMYEKITQSLTKMIKMESVPPSLLDKVLGFFHKGVDKGVEEDTPMKLIEWRSQQREEKEEPSVKNLFEERTLKASGERFAGTSYGSSHVVKESTEATIEPAVRARTGVANTRVGISSRVANTSVHNSSTFQPTISYRPIIRENRENGSFYRQTNNYSENTHNIPRASQRILESQRALREQQPNIRSNFIFKNNRKSTNDSNFGQLKSNIPRKHTEPVNYRSSRTARGLTYHSRPEPTSNLCLMSRPAKSKQLEDQGRITRNKSTQKYLNKSTEKYLNKSMQKYPTGPTLRNSHSSVGVMKRFRYLADNDYGHTSYCA